MWLSILGILLSLSIFHIVEDVSTVPIMPSFFTNCYPSDYLHVDGVNVLIGLC